MDEKKKKLFDGMDILSLEGAITKAWEGSREAQKETLEILIYLQETGRFKENEKYRKESFWTYLDDRFHIRMGTFYEMKRAFLKFPEETIKHGVGLVAKIERVCGTKNEKAALQEIEKATQQKELNRRQIERIIEKHRDPSKKKTEVKDYKALYHRAEKELQEARERIKELEKENEELRLQNEKLRKTAQKVVEIRKMVQERSAASV